MEIVKKRYVFFRGMIDTLDLYTDEFIRIYKEQDAECLVLDTAHMDTELLRLKAFLLAPVTAVISLNNVGLHLEFEDGKNIWDSFQIPFYNIMMDHPFRYKKALDMAPEQMTLLCMDRNHVEYARRFFPNIQNVEFFPHAGIELQEAETQTQADTAYAEAEPQTQAGMVYTVKDYGRIPISERRIDVLYAGGLARYAAEGLIPDLGKITDFDAFLLVRRALERLIHEPGLTTEYVIEKSLRDMNLSFDDKKLGEIISELRFLDSFAVSFYREEVIRTLAENGITVTVFGKGWDRLEWEHPNLVYGGEIYPVQILELMNQSRIVLNTMTWFKRGAHDRIFNGMLAGAAVVTDDSEYLQEHFTSGRELEMFSLRDIKNLPERVNDLLEHPGKAQRIADCGYQSAAAHHTWKNRLHDMDI